MIRYLYNRQFEPPAPFVHVHIRCPETGTNLSAVPALIDTAADRTTITKAVIDSLGLKPAGDAVVTGFGGNVSVVSLYSVQLSIRDFPSVHLAAFGHTEETYVLLGRDVLNRVHIVLDGPQLAFEIS